MADQGGPLAPAGWYPDPTVPGQQRYWDGTQWTEHTAAGPGSTRPLGGGAPAPPPGAQATGWQGGGGERPDPWLWQSIVATVLCCLPAGIAAIVFASQAQGALNAGDLALAREKAAKARTWTLVSVGVGAGFVLLWLVLVLSGTAASTYWSF